MFEDAGFVGVPIVVEPDAQAVGTVADAARSPDVRVRRLGVELLGEGSGDPDAGRARRRDHRCGPRGAGARGGSLEDRRSGRTDGLRTGTLRRRPDRPPRGGRRASFLARTHPARDAARRRPSGRDGGRSGAPRFGRRSDRSGRAPARLDSRTPTTASGPTRSRSSGRQIRRMPRCCCRGCPTRTRRPFARPCSRRSRRSIRRRRSARRSRRSKPRTWRSARPACTSSCGSTCEITAPSCARSPRSRPVLAILDAELAASIPADEEATALLRDAVVQRGRGRAVVALSTLALQSDDRGAAHVALDNLDTRDPRSSRTRSRRWRSPRIPRSFAPCSPCGRRCRHRPGWPEASGCPARASTTTRSSGRAPISSSPSATVGTGTTTP